MPNYAVILVDANDSLGRPVGSVADAVILKNDAPCPDGRILMTAEELDALRARHATAVAAYVAASKLAKVKYNKVLQLKHQITALIESRYSDAQQRTLTMLYQEAVAADDLPRVSQIQPAISWIKSAVSRYYTCRNAIKAATTIDEINAVELDVAELVALAPRVDIEDVLTA